MKLSRREKLVLLVFVPIGIALFAWSMTGDAPFWAAGAAIGLTAGPLGAVAVRRMIR